jgi:hypothetical protein
VIAGENRTTTLVLPDDGGVTCHVTLSRALSFLVSSLHSGAADLSDCNGSVGPTGLA